MARRLFARGGLWNSVVMAGWAGRLLALVEAAAPDLARPFGPVEHSLGSSEEWVVLGRTYASLPALNFSRRVLARAPGCLITIRASGLEWSDRGTRGG